MFVAFLVIIYSSVYFALSPGRDVLTPDELVYLSNAQDFLRYGILLPFDYDPVRPYTAVVKGRLLWQLYLAFVEAASGTAVPPAPVVNLPFLLVYLASTYMLIRELVDFPEALILWTAVAFNPFAVVYFNFYLTDFAFASLSLLSIYYLIWSLRRWAKLTGILKSYIVAALALLVKLNMLLVIAHWILLVVVFAWKKYWRLSKWHKTLFIVAIALPVAYELLLDVPAHITYYVLHDLNLNRVFSRYVFVSPLGLLVNFFYKTPFSPGRLWYDIPIHEKYLYLVNTLSVDVYSPLLSSLALLSPLLFWKERRHGIMLSLLLFLLLPVFYFHILNGNLWDLARNSLLAFVILEVTGLTALYAVTRSNTQVVVAAFVASQLLLYAEYIVSLNYKATFQVPGSSLYNFLERTLWVNGLVASALMLLVVEKVHSRIPVRTQRAIALVLVTVLLLANSYETFRVTFEKNAYLRQHGVHELLAKLGEANCGSSIVLTNIPQLKLYLPPGIVVVNSPLSQREAQVLLGSGLEVCVAFTSNVIPSWVSYRVGAYNYMKSMFSCRNIPGQTCGANYTVTIFEGERLKQSPSSVKLEYAKLEVVVNASGIRQKYVVTLGVNSEEQYNNTLIILQGLDSVSRVVVMNIVQGLNEVKVEIPSKVRDLDIGIFFSRKLEITVLHPQSRSILLKTLLYLRE
ncbi:ArnT family glycosyltransferase [Thermofilum pendens]